MNDPRSRALASVAIDRTWVLRSKPIVFVFGGRIDLSAPGTSVRSDLLRYISSNNSSLADSLVVPEDFPDWLHDSTYPDLLTFERDLAATATLIVIALESAGAIAELGAFSLLRNFHEKLLIVLSSQHYQQKSFVTLGPLRLLDESRNILAYPFDYSKLELSLQDYLEDIAGAIENGIASSRKKVPFRKTNRGHIAFLIVELLQIFRALSRKEIDSYLNQLGLKVPTNTLSRVLFLLQKLELIDKQRMDRHDYYFPIRTDQWIDLVAKTGQFERNAVRLEVAAYYETEKTEAKRKKFIRNCL